jgi:hypothetical protein
MDDTKKSDRQAEQSHAVRRVASRNDQRAPDAVRPSDPALTNPGETQLWTIDDFAARLKCSTRHLRRLIDAGRAPAPIRLGALLRFDSEVASKWMSDGCPDRRKVSGR